MYEDKKITWHLPPSERRVLIADDVAVDCKQLEMALAREGISSTSVHCAADAIRKAKEDDTVDFVVTDLNMPWDNRGGIEKQHPDKNYQGELGGVIVAKELRGVVPVMAYTSIESVELKAHIKKGLFQGFILKDDRFINESAARVLAIRQGTDSYYFKEQRLINKRDKLNHRLKVHFNMALSEKNIEKYIISFCARKEIKVLEFTREMSKAVGLYDNLITHIRQADQQEKHDALAKRIEKKVTRKNDIIIEAYY